MTRMRGTWAPELICFRSLSVQVSLVLLLAPSGADAVWPARGELHEAVRSGDAEVVSRLLAAGANPNRRDDVGDLPLHLATSRGDGEVMDLLLGAGAEVDALDGGGRTALFLATTSGLASAVERLLHHGAEPDLAITSRWRPLHRAAGYGPDDVFDALLAGGADIGLPNGQGVTPLHLAAAAGATRRVELLLDRGTNPDARTAMGKTALHFARDHGQTGVAELLVARGAKDLRVAFPDIRGRYLGMREPGLTPHVFAPDIMAQPFPPHGPLDFSPDGRELYFSFNALPVQSRWVMRADSQGAWSAPEVSFLQPGVGDNGLTLSDDGRRATFHSWRSEADGTDRSPDANLWYSVRSDPGGSWSPPRKLTGALETGDHDYYLSRDRTFG